MDITVKLQIGVMAGNQRYRGLLPMYTKSAQGILLLYDTANVSTFLTLEKWLESIRKIAAEAIIFIVGARSDLFHKREVLFKEGLNFARSKNLEFFECSAKTGENVEWIFNQMTLRILQKNGSIPFIPSVEMEIEGKSIEWKGDKYVPDTCRTEEEMLNGSANKTNISNPTQKDTSNLEDNESESRAEDENLTVIKDLIGTQSSSKLNPLDPNENCPPSNDKKDVTPKVEKHMLSEDEILLVGKCPAWLS